jgi:hypothetical protein
MSRFVFRECSKSVTFVTLYDRGIDPEPVHAKFSPKELGIKHFLYRPEVRRWMNR